MRELTDKEKHEAWLLNHTYKKGFKAGMQIASTVGAVVIMVLYLYLPHQ